MSTLLMVNSRAKRKRSDAGIELIFLPGGNFLFELNEVAALVLDRFGIPATLSAVVEGIAGEFEPAAFDEISSDIHSLVERFLEHKILVEAVE